MYLTTISDTMVIVSAHMSLNFQLDQGFLSSSFDLIAILATLGLLITYPIIALKKLAKIEFREGRVKD